MREIVLDTETTGFEPEEGHRVIEIAAIELHNLIPTGRHFHSLLDPERDVPPEATRIHGFTRADLEGKPRFPAQADALLGFLGEAPIVAHNAAFDFRHLDAELARIGRPPLDPARMVDSLALARERFPGAPNSLDALCRRYEIDLSERTTHNALLDVRLLAQVYLELRGGRQLGLGLGAAPLLPAMAREGPVARTPRPILVPPERAAAHEAFIARLTDPVWKLRP